MQEENNFYNNGWKKVRQKDYSGASADFLNAFKAAEKESTARFLAFFSRGCVELYLKQYDKALKTFNSVIDWHLKNKTPENAEHGKAFFNRGLAHAGLRKKDEAIKDFYTALDYGSGAASYAVKAWRELNALGQFDQAELSSEEKPKPLPVTPAKVVAKSLPNAWKESGTAVKSVAHAPDVKKVNGKNGAGKLGAGSKRR